MRPTSTGYGSSPASPVSDCSWRTGDGPRARRLRRSVRSSPRIARRSCSATWTGRPSLTGFCELLGAPCPEPLTRLLFEQTAGLPVLLEQLMVGLRDSGQLSTEVLSHLAPRVRLDVPAGVQEQLRYVIEALPAEVRHVLFAATLGAGGDTETLTQLLKTDGPTINAALREAQATGLMADDGTVVPLVGRLLLRLAPAGHTNRVCEMLAGLQLRRGGSMLPVGQALMTAGAQGPQVATVLLAAGNEALGSGQSWPTSFSPRPVRPERRPFPARLPGRRRRAQRPARRSAAAGGRGAERRACRRTSRALGITAAVLAHRGRCPVRPNCTGWPGRRAGPITR